ncbi:MAG: universal stress protein [Myxococcota bacterium]
MRTDGDLVGATQGMEPAWLAEAVAEIDQTEAEAEGAPERVAKEPRIAPHVLVATDLSENSVIAAEVGAEFATMLGARVTLIHSFDPEPFVPPLAIPSPQAVTRTLAKELSEAVRSGLIATRKKYLASCPNVELATVRGSNAASRVCDYAANHGVDWIVVGTHGRTGFGRVLLGSVAERIVRHAPCSVIVARPNLGQAHAAP